MAKALVNPRSVYTWDAKVLKYRGPNGQFVSQKAIKQALNSYVRNAQREIERLAAQVASGKIPVGEWQRQTANLIKSAHLASASAARGGWGQMTAADFGKAGVGLREQYKFLRKFAKQLHALPPGDIVRRSGMYARSAAGAYEQARFDSYADLVEQGAAVRMRNRLSRTADHCKPRNGKPGCVEESARGWVEFGELSLPGQRACATNCRCRVEYKIIREPA